MSTFKNEHFSLLSDQYENDPAYAASLEAPTDPEDMFELGAGIYSQENGDLRNPLSLKAIIELPPVP